MEILLPVLAAAIAFPLSWYACGLTRHAGVVDAPDGKRKRQAAPVPRLGGLGIIAAIAIVFALAWTAHALIPAFQGHDWLPGPARQVIAALAISGLLAAIGAWDDIHALAPRTKLGLVVIACIAAAMLGIGAASLQTPFGSIDLPIVLLAGSALWLLVFSNAANFMDGSNGLSLGSLAVMFAGLGAGIAMQAGAAYPPGLIAIIAAIAGFLVHNMAGTLYAGDAGAFGIGGLFATLALISGLPVWTVATLALPFLVDVLLTLIMRAKHRQAWFEAHTDHAYQALLQAGWRHWDVAVLWWMLSGACAIAATVGAAAGGALPFVLFWLFAIILSGLWLSVQRKLGNHVARPVDG